MRRRIDSSPFSPRRFIDASYGRAAGRVVLTLAVLLGVASWYVSRTALDNTIEERFEFRTEEVTTSIEDRMATYEQVLWGGTALFNANSDVTRDEWRLFVDSLNLQENWPGIQGMGFAIPVEPEDLARHEAAIRAEGFPDYGVSPADPARDIYSAIIYLEPFDWRNQRAFGYDMWSNDVRREAMARARDSGEAASSGLITLVQETDEDVQRGFLTYLPVYEGGSIPPTVEERRAEFIGWVYAPFRMGDLMHQVIGPYRSDLNFEIYDNGVLSSDTLLFDTDDESSLDGGDESDLQRRIWVTHAGHDWLVSFTATDELVADLDRRTPTLIAGAAVLTNVLLFFAIWTLSSLERRAAEIAAERTEDLTEAKAALEERSLELERYATELERSNSELAQFAHVAAHDLQEPLRTIGNYSQLVASRYHDRLDDDGQRWLEFVSSGAQRMSNLIRSLLNYSSVDGNVVPFEPVDLNVVLDKALRELASSVEVADAKIVRDHLPTVVGDDEQLVRLLQNLVGNSIKYRSPEEPLVVRISGREDGDTCQVTVADNGIGIKEEYHGRIFELFRRGGKQPESEGTGLGLAICRRIVERHGGTIGVQSLPGEGSIFTVTLPRAVSPASSPAGTRADERPRRNDPSVPGPRSEDLVMSAAATGDRSVE